jgi:hypothetical protein
MIIDFDRGMDTYTHGTIEHVERTVGTRRCHASCDDEFINPQGSPRFISPEITLLETIFPADVDPYADPDSYPYDFLC